MRLQICQKGGYKRDELIQEVVEYCLSQLLTTRMINTLSLRIEMRASKLKKDIGGTCFILKNGSKATKTFTIVCQRDSQPSAMIRTLAHEMVHVAQAAKNRLQYTAKDKKTAVRWEGKAMGWVEEIPYLERPWEKEAFELQETLTLSYLLAQKRIGKGSYQGN